MEKKNKIANKRILTYTPGPWKFKQSVNPKKDREEDCIIYVKNENANQEALHIAETFQYQNHDYNSANGVSLANARLISAAPDLYKVCKYLAENGWNAGVTEMAREAIAKAEEA